MVALLCLFLLLPIPFAQADSLPPEEIPIERVLSPPSAFDDLTPSHLLVEGTLPDGCYEPAPPLVQPNLAAHSFTVAVWASRRTDGACGTGDLAGSAGYSEDVSLGVLPTGTYLVHYQSPAGNEATTSFVVSAAAPLDQPGKNPADVAALEGKEFFLAGETVSFTLHGLLRASCDTIVQPLIPEEEGDAYVLTPLEINRGHCPHLPPDLGLPGRWTATVSLGRPATGEHLLYVRTRGGAIARSFTVL